MKTILLAVCGLVACLAGAKENALGWSWVHRGDGFNRPENSLEALLYCWGNGAIPEADIRHTKDDVIIAYHNGALKGRPINEWTWAELREVDIGAGRGKGDEWRGVRVPTFHAIFASMVGRPDRKLYMDWKDVSVEQAAALVKAYGLESQVYCHACSTSRLRKWKAAVPTGKTSLWLWIGSWGHIDFGAPGAVEKGEAFMRKMFDAAAKDNFAGVDVVHLLIQCDFSKPDPFCPTTPCLKEMIRRAHAAGRPITCFPWGKDGETEEPYHRLKALGFDGWGTDCPDVMYSAAKKSR